MIEPGINSWPNRLYTCQLRHETTPSATKGWIKTATMDSNWIYNICYLAFLHQYFQLPTYVRSPTPCCSYLPLFRLRANRKENLLPRALSKKKKHPSQSCSTIWKVIQTIGSAKRIFWEIVECLEVRLEKNQLEVHKAHKHRKQKHYTKHCFFIV